MPETAPREFGSWLLRQVLAASVVWSLALPVAGAEVALLKGGDTPGLRLVVDGLRRTLNGNHTVREYTVGSDGSGAALVGQLESQGAIVVLLGPQAAEAASALQFQARSRVAFALLQDPGRLGLDGVSGVLAGVPVRSQFALFRLVYPRLVRLGVLYGPGVAAGLIDEAQKVAPGLRLVVVPRPLASHKDVPEALRSLLRGDGAVDGLWFPPDPLLLEDLTRRFVLSECLKSRRPVFSFSEALVAEGALASSGPDMASVGERLGDIVRRLAGGESPASIGLLVPKGELVINQKVADSLKVELPAGVLDTAARRY